MNKYVELGQKLYDEGKLNCAEDAFNKALVQDSLCAEAYQGLATVYFYKNEFDKSIEMSLQSIDLFGNANQAKTSDCFVNLAMAYKAKRNINNALFCYENAILLNVDNYDAYFGISVTYLLNKDFENGFKLYRSRFFKSESVLGHFFENKQEWQGENIDNKTLYVYHEQGFGDNIQFLRYLKDLSIKTEAKVIYKTRVELEELFKENDFNIQIVKNDVSDADIEFDFYTHLLSIPQLIGANIDNIPLSNGYLKANEQKAKEYKNTYFGNDKFKLGIVWRGTPDSHIDKVLSLEYFLKFLKNPNIKIYSLQVDLTINEQEQLQSAGVQDLGKTFNDFSDTAAAIENLDLLISVDTSVAHLSGAMNKPVWILLPYIPEWRWFLDSEKSPWYDSAKLYRQSETRNWDEVFECIANDLKGYSLTISGSSCNS